MRNSAARKTAATIVKQFKQKSQEELGQKLDADYRSANKVFWKIIRQLRGKGTPVAVFIEGADSVLLKHQLGILNCWKEYFCELLNPVTVQHSETFEEQIGEEIHLTEAELITAIKSLKAGKTPEMMLDPKC